MDGEPRVPVNHMDNLPIGTPVRTCNNYYRIGLIGLVVEKLDNSYENGYVIRTLSEDIEKVYVGNLELIDLTDLEKLLYNVKSP